MRGTLADVLSAWDEQQAARLPAVTVFRTDAPRVFAKIQTWAVTLALVVQGRKTA